MAPLSVVQVVQGTPPTTNNILLTAGTTLASLESLSMPLVQEVVVSADIRCSDCKKRVADLMSRMTETESVLINVFEKRVIITCKYPNLVKKPPRQLTTVNTNPLNKIAIIKRFFGYSRN